MKLGIDLENPPQSVGLEIARRLEELGLSQTDLASCLGINYPRLITIITGKRDLKPEEAFLLAKFFDTEVTYWLTRQAEYLVYKFQSHPDVNDMLDKVEALSELEFEEVEEIVYE